ncbi:hypothetical protein D9M69_539790 [compost metagenome]
MWTDFGIKVDSLDLNEACLAIREAGSGNRALTFGGLDSQLDIAVKDTGLVAFDLGNDDPTFLHHDWCRNHVHISHLRADQTGKSRTDQSARVHGRSRTIKKHFHFLNRLVRHLTDKGTQNLCELDERLETRRFFRCDRRHVDGIGYRALDEIIRHLFGHLDRHIFLCFGSRGTKMRCADHIGQIE